MPFSQGVAMQERSRIDKCAQLQSDYPDYHMQNEKKKCTHKNDDAVWESSGDTGVGWAAKQMSTTIGMVKTCFLESLLPNNLISFLSCDSPAEEKKNSEEMMIEEKRMCKEHGMCE